MGDPDDEAHAGLCGEGLGCRCEEGAAAELGIGEGKTQGAVWKGGRGAAAVAMAGGEENGAGVLRGGVWPAVGGEEGFSGSGPCQHGGS